MPTTATLREEALSLARRGLPVFPCNGDKTPRTPNGFKDASTSEDVVDAWHWETPHTMIGLAPPVDLVVLDVDPRHGGDETMTGVDLPETYAVGTPGGGYHLYFYVPAVAPARKLYKEFGPGVDIKGCGSGYVIAPPSAGYAVTVDAAVALAPEWLVEAITKPEQATTVGEAHEPKFFEEFQHGTAYGERALALELAELAQAGPGGRNHALNKAAFSLAQLAAGGELDGEHALQQLALAAEAIGLEPAETRKTLESGWGAGLDQPRQAPEREENVFAGLDKPRRAPVDESAMWLDWTTEAEPISFLLHPIIPRKAYVWVYGPAAASKSMVFNLLGAQASHQGIRTTVYSLENPRSIDHNRLKRMSPDPANFRLTNEPIDLADRAQVDELIDREKRWDTELLVLDTYSHAFGDRGEDGNAKAIEFARRIREVMHEVGCSVVVLDHTGYAHDEPRDASAKRQQVDVCILMAQADERWEPGRDAQFRMENRKAARFGNPFDLAGEIRGRHDEPLTLHWHGTEPTWLKDA